MRIPTHLAIIMDGNGRWAEKRRLPRIFGHRKGVETVQAVVDDCLAQGVKFLTLFAFSSENWGRPRDEVEALMGLLGSFLQKELKQLQERGIKLVVIGEMDRLPTSIRKILEKVIDQTVDNDRLTLCLALSYGSRDELTRAVRSIGRQVADGTLEPGQIDEETVAGALDTIDLPDPDLLIRTSGETRISNFLLWQLAYAELYFLDVLWPDFSTDHLLEAFAEFGRRQRRFGLTGAQLQGSEKGSQEESH